MKKRKFLVLGVVALLGSVTLCGCGNNQPPVDDSNDGDNNNNNEDIPVDYGTVRFDNLNVYDFINTDAGIPIRPVFSNPDACKDEVFEYTLNKENCIFIEDSKVYYAENGTTKVTAQSQHLKGTFYVFSANAYPNANAMSRAKYLYNNFTKNPRTGSTLFFGDSFFEFWAYGTGGVKPFSTVFSGYDVQNFGISGTTTADWLSLNPKLLSPMNPKNIVVNIGINDVDDLGRTGEETAYNVQRLIYELHTQFSNAKIYYISITHCSNVYFEAKWPYSSKSNEIIQDFCNKNEYMKYLDLASLYGDDYDSYEQDGLHPNQKGYDLIEKLVKDNVPLDTL